MNLKAQGFEGEVSYRFYLCRADEELNMFPICQAQCEGAIMILF